MRVSLNLKDGNLVLKTPYSRDLVDDLKASIPTIARRWDPSNKVWVIAYMHGQDIIEVVERNLGIQLAIPKQVTYADPQPVTRLLKIEYIGAAKERENGDITATGYCNGEWSVSFPLKVLRRYFEGDSNGSIKPDGAPTYYAVLGVAKNATDRDIKRAYRIAAKTWHPDLNDTPDAPTQFRQIRTAYEILSDGQQRRKYDAGLYLQSKAGRGKGGGAITEYAIWLPPKRCGYVTVVGKEFMGRMSVERILRWDDIIESGLIMVSFWPKGATMFEADWV
jgi:hypothetical protein